MLNEHTQLGDLVSVRLRTYAQNILVVVFGLLPLFFIPTQRAPFDYTKAFVVIVALMVALVLVSLSTLRAGAVRIERSYTLLTLWVIGAFTFISALLSGDLKDALVGDFFSIHATVFVGILALIPTVWMLVAADKHVVLRLYLLIATSTIILSIFHLVRLVGGPATLDFGIFTSNVSSVVGSWNDLALFLGLAIIISLMGLEQLKLNTFGRVLFGVAITVSLLMLAVVNFFLVWIIVGFMSLVLLVYTIGKDRFTGDQLSFVSPRKQMGRLSGIMMSLVFVVSVLFIIGGATFGGALSQVTGISYVEVRPSFEATVGIMRQVYHENAFLGIGANKFTDAWRLYKDVSINTTPFWNTDFNAGSGYIPTFFVTTGILGGLAWLVFIGTFIVSGARALLGTTEGDRMWYFIGLSSFASALYVWGVSLVYVPGVVVLLFGALCTGVSLSAFSHLKGLQNVRVFSVGNSHRSGFVLTLGVIAMVVVSLTVLYATGRHYNSIFMFNDTVIKMSVEGSNTEQLEEKVLEAYQLSESDIFARRIAEFELVRMNNLASIASTTENDVVLFRRAMETGIQVAKGATDLDVLEPANWALLGNIYAFLARIGVEGAQSEAIASFAKERDLNPHNPLPYLELGIMEGRAGNFDTARAHFEKAIEFKPNYTEAYFYLSQLEISQGKIDEAIRLTRATINLDPQNAVRYYQLGVLLSAQNNMTDAIASFEKAVEIDQNYANAHYLLALSYDANGESARAKTELEKVLNLNPGNTEVTALIEKINTEGSLKTLREAEGGTQAIQQPVGESLPLTNNENGTVISNQRTDSSLITPVNTSPVSKPTGEPEISTAEVSQ